MSYIFWPYKPPTDNIISTCLTFSDPTHSLLTTLYVGHTYMSYIFWPYMSLLYVRHMYMSVTFSDPAYFLLILLNVLHRYISVILSDPTRSLLIILYVLHMHMSCNIFWPCAQSNAQSKSTRDKWTMYCTGTSVQAVFWDLWRLVRVRHPSIINKDRKWINTEREVCPNLRWTMVANHSCKQP